MTDPIEKTWCLACGKSKLAEKATQLLAVQAEAASSKSQMSSGLLHLSDRKPVKRKLSV